MKKIIFSLLFITYISPAFGDTYDEFYNFQISLNNNTFRVYKNDIPSAEDIEENPCKVISGDTIQILGASLSIPLFGTKYLIGPVENQSPRVKDLNCIPEYIKIYFPNLKDISKDVIGGGSSE